MKILFLIDSLGSGGAQRQMTTVASLLNKIGYEVSFLVYSEGDFFKQSLKDNSIPITTISSTNIIKRIFRIRKFIRCGNYDAVISFMDTPNFLNCFAAIGGKNWNVITSERSSKESTFNTRKNRIFNWFQRYSDSIVCNSENSRKMWVKYYPKFNKKLHVIYNTVILSKVTSIYTPLRNGKIHIVVAASYQGLKNSIGLISALALLNSGERKRFSVDWYGRKNVDSIEGMGIYDDSIDLIKNNKLGNIISLHGPTNDIYNKMHAADFVGLFSTVEGLPNTICESMSFGKPIIMTRVSDYNQFIDDSNGVICEKTTPNAIAVALRKLLNLTADDILKMGECSQRKSKVLFNSEKIIDLWENTINK
ncbi:glycosyltransferase [Marinifilum sp. RC60d5]|uniref:glycosyltransferase n=1 Tax=Marinifilum sp. RC60d5 TaxID=3458414 RepID=UPI00403574B0